jgi:ubiquinone/menaquinone biosynthesis C-methylase UbiE
VSELTAPPAAAEVPPHFRRNAALNPHQRRRHRAVLALIGELPPGRVLDYGCGYGDLTFAISRTHPDVIGVDVAPDRVAFARSEYAPLRFEVCAAQGLDFPDASFDIVTSVVVVPFVPDPGAYLDEVRRVLKPGGHLIIAMKTWPALRRLYRRLRDGRGVGTRARSALHLYTIDGAAELLAEHGFSVLRREAFYDPFFSSRKNAADIVNALVELGGELLGVRTTAPYPLLLARRD